MAVPASLFFSSTSYQVGGIKLDLLLDETHALVSSVSERAIESGAPVADHVQRQLREGQLTGLVSNFSLKAPIPELSLLLQTKIATRRRVTASDVPQGDRPTNRAMDAYRLFKSLWENAVPVTISTTMETYENVVVTEVQTGRNGGTGDALEFRVRFRQVRIVTLEQVKIEASVKPLKPGKAPSVSKDLAAKQASAKQDNGRTTGTEMSLDEVEVRA